MVRGYDSTKSDPSKILLDYLFGFYDMNKSVLSPTEASQYVKGWISESSITSWVYKEFDKMLLKPKIILRKSCPVPFSKKEPFEGDAKFPAFEENSEIHICLNNVKNKIELKENLDRELYIMYYKQVKEVSSPLDEKEKDRMLIKEIYEGCLKGYENYNWEPHITQRFAKKCAVYLFRRRTPSDLPPDSIFRYSSHLADSTII